MADKDAAKTRLIARDRRARAVQSLKITVTGGPDAGTSRLVEQRSVVVGRSAGADFVLNDPSVSAFHVELSAGDDGIAVADLKSTNGTWHGGLRVERAVAPPNVTLEIGDSLLRVEPGSALEAPMLDASSFGELQGHSRVMRELFWMLARLSRTELSILIEGPTGTGKELAARAVHTKSRVGRGPFVVLDCTSIPAALAESTLFGHEKGAFTGAAERRHGVFEAADGGTVFLDEVGELPAELQPKLLRVLERREVVRVGSTAAVPVRVRVVCATWRDLRAMVNQGRFRDDLYYRLAQARVAMPPLAERPEDIGQLVTHFLGQRAADDPGARAIAPEALAELAAREYPGNVRELKNMVDRAAALAEGAVITPADLAFERMLAGERSRGGVVRAAGAAPAVNAPAPGVSAPATSAEMAPFKEAKRTIIDEFERDYLQRLLVRSEYNLSRAAATAGVERHYLRELFKKHGLSTEEG